MKNKPRAVRHLEKGVLESLRKKYANGTKVEAIRVEGIPRGIRGVVMDVRDNGDLVVGWSTGEEGIVEYENECVKAVAEGSCLLGHVMGWCGGEECIECGWNVRVNQARVKRIHNNEMVEDENGVKKLVIEKKMFLVS